MNTPSANWVMVVDDDPETLLFLSEQLKSRGYQVITAGSAGEAAVMARGMNFAVVICDLRMPIVDGVDCLGMIKARCPETEVIMISGEATVKGVVDSMKKGALDFIQKPIEMEHFFKSLNCAVARYQMRHAA